VPFPEPDALDDLYDRSWSDPDANTAEVGSLPDERAAAVVRVLRARVGLRGHIVDFGAGSGALSRVLHDAGSEVTAVEPYGFERLVGSTFPVARQLDEVAGQIDGIVALEVLEHLREPWDVVRALRARLAPSGWLYVTTPNVAGLNARLRRSSWRELTKAGHIVLFTPRSLSRILRDAGYTRIERVPVPPTTGSAARRSVQSLLQLTRLDGGVHLLAHP
jgi:2-polyprenyl-3-methyl-5-hydroxy-6-metoxy-1,4-benzoquinol methylase